MSPLSLMDPCGTQLWDQLIYEHPNVVMVLCGHVGFVGRSQRTNEAGRKVNEFLLDYTGCDGVLGEAGRAHYGYPGPPYWYYSDKRTSAVARLMTIDPLSNRVKVKQWDCEMCGWLSNIERPTNPTSIDESNFEFRLLEQVPPE